VIISKRNLLYSPKLWVLQEMNLQLYHRQWQKTQ